METLDFSAIPQTPMGMIANATSLADWVLVWPLILCLIGAGVLVMLRRYTRLHLPITLLIIALVVVSDSILLMRVWANGPLAMTMGNWQPPFGISFNADMMSAIFALTAAVVSLVVALYMQIDLSAKDQKYGFYPLMLLMLAGVSGAFLTGDIFNLYVWFEVMLMSSFGLLVIGGRKAQLDAAIKYGFLNFLATTFFLVAIAYIYGVTGTLNMADVLSKIPSVDPATTIIIGTLFVFAFGAKAAMFPLSSWLPASYHTPSAGVSALFGGLLTKVGIYGIIRIVGQLMPDAMQALSPFIMVLAIAGLIIAPLGAMAEVNLRRAIGYFVIGGIGASLVGVAMNTEQGYVGAIAYSVHSMVTMAAFYLLAGLIEKRTGSRLTTGMGGVYAKSSLVSIGFIVLMFGVAGVPPMLGFWPKLVLVTEAITLQNYWALGAILLNAFLSLIVLARLWAHIFLRNSVAGSADERNLDGLEAITLVGWSKPVLRYGFTTVIGLMLIVVGLGVFPEPLIKASSLAATDVMNADAYYQALFGVGAPQ